MPKSEKPKGPDLMPVAEVARRLRVTNSQVESWLQKNQLRGNESGIRPYDFKKFQLDHAEEIGRAQREATQTNQTKSDRKPKKGILSKFKSMFSGNEKETPGQSDSKLSSENKRLKAELKRLSKSSKDERGNDSKELEERIRFLETKASKANALEGEVKQLKKELSQASSLPVSSQETDDLLQELERAKQELSDARRETSQSLEHREALERSHSEVSQLQATVRQLQAGRKSQAEIQQLQLTAYEGAQALEEVQLRTQKLLEENTALREEIARNGSGHNDDGLVAELLELQSLNLARYQRLHALYEQCLERLNSVPTESNDELVTLQEKYEKLLNQTTEIRPEMTRQLADAKATAAQFQAENAALKDELSLTGEHESSSEKVIELEKQLKDAQNVVDTSPQLESELRAVKKSLQAKENQVQKVAGRLTDNEKLLSKALKESARLTELLIERETRLRELSTEFEQEYRDKMENLDRQVSGLQWKLSLREERIAHLESELLRKGES